MNAIRTLSSVLVIALAAAADLAAQQDTLVVPGARVRVTAPTVAENHLVGTVAAVDADTLVLGVNHGTSSLAIPFASMTSLEVSRGKKSKAGLGAIIGAPIGLVAGALIGYAASGGGGTFPLGEGLERLEEGGDAMAAGALLGGLTGGLIGALIGSSIKVDRWETVPLDRIRVSLTTRGGGLEVSAKFVF